MYRKDYGIKLTIFLIEELKIEHCFLKEINPNARYTRKKSVIPENYSFGF